MLTLNETFTVVVLNPGCVPEPTGHVYSTDSHSSTVVHVTLCVTDSLILPLTRGGPALIPVFHTWKFTPEAQSFIAFQVHTARKGESCSNSAWQTPWQTHCWHWGWTLGIPGGLVHSPD